MTNYTKDEIQTNMFLFLLVMFTPFRSVLKNQKYITYVWVLKLIRCNCPMNTVRL